MTNPVLEPIVTRVVTERNTVLLMHPEGGSPRRATREDLEKFLGQLQLKGSTCCMPDCEEAPHYCKAHYDSELTTERASYDRSRRELIDQVQALSTREAALLDELAAANRALGAAAVELDETKAALERTTEERNTLAGELAELHSQHAMADAFAGAEEPPRARAKGGKRTRR